MKNSVGKIGGRNGADKNDTVWRKTKEGVKTKGIDLGSVPFDVLKEYAKLQLKNIFDMQ